MALKVVSWFQKRKTNCHEHVPLDNTLTTIWCCVYSKVETAEQALAEAGHMLDVTICLQVTTHTAQHSLATHRTIAVPTTNMRLSQDYIHVSTAAWNKHTRGSKRYMYMYIHCSMTLVKTPRVEVKPLLLVRLCKKLTSSMFRSHFETFVNVFSFVTSYTNTIPCGVGERELLKM